MNNNYLINVTSQQTQSNKIKILETKKTNINKNVHDQNKVHLPLRNSSLCRISSFFILNCYFFS